ncbi:MAG: transcriptional regulator [Candidatus Thermoplasmatota archaeon]|jgi:predicted transcriptional regulator|nr:transcriptional regulator [Candidatus Thermoplasmatota archaeon]MCL5679490.1 transcriptional regulator [Candidatus Thermoplasmatota archaeon]
MVDDGQSIFREITRDIANLRRHISIIENLLKEQPQGIIRISQETGIPRHKIRYSLRMLEHDNIILASKEGAIISPDFIKSKERVLEESEHVVEEINDLNQSLRSMLSRK